MTNIMFVEKYSER